MTNDGACARVLFVVASTSSQLSFHEFDAMPAATRPRQNMRRRERDGNGEFVTKGQRGFTSCSLLRALNSPEIKSRF